MVVSNSDLNFIKPSASVATWNKPLSAALREKCSIWSYSGMYFPAFGLNRDLNNSEYRYFLRSAIKLGYQIN